MTKQELGEKSGKAFCDILQSIQDAQSLVFEYDKMAVDKATSSMFKNLIYGLADEYTSIVNKIDMYMEMAPLLPDKLRAEFAEFYNAFVTNIGKFGHDNCWTETIKLID